MQRVRSQAPAEREEGSGTSICCGPRFRYPDDLARPAGRSEPARYVADLGPELDALVARPKGTVVNVPRTGTVDQ